MFLPGVDNSNHLPRWQLSKSYRSLIFNFVDQVELKRAYNYIWSQYGGKQSTLAMRPVNVLPYNDNQPTILEVIFRNDQIKKRAMRQGIRYNNRVITPFTNVRSDVIYIAYPLFDLPLNDPQDVVESLYEEFAEPNDDIKELSSDNSDSPQDTTDINHLNDYFYSWSLNRTDTNQYDDDDGDDDESDDGSIDVEVKEGVVDVVLGEDDSTGLYNGTATVIVRRMLPMLMKITQLLDQQRHRHLLPTNVRVYHLYCKSCNTLDDHPDGNCD